MAILTKVKFHDNERADLTDIRNLSEFACADWSQFFDKVYTPTTYIVTGFRVFQDVGLTNDNPTVSPIYIELSNSVIIHTSPDMGDSPSFYVGAENQAPAQISLTNNAINYIELELSSVDSEEDTRGFWDPTANDNIGKPFSQVVNTVTYVEATITSNTSGFSGGNKVPIAHVSVDSGGTIIEIYDRRNLFHSLARSQPYDNDYQYGFPNGRTPFVHSVTLGSDQGFYIHYQETPDTTWTITHNLGIQYVDIEIFDLNGQKVSDASITSITADDANTTTVVFGVAQDGYAAILVGPASDRFIHNQGASNATWTVTHNLGTQYVNVEVYDSSDERITHTVTTIEATSANVVTITLGGADTGNVIVTRGVSTGTYLHTEASPSATWVIDHDLGYSLGTFTFWDGTNDEMVLPDTVICNNANTLTATFSGPVEGFARFTSDNGGTYISDEVVVGNISTTTAKVVSGGTTAIDIYAKEAPEFAVGETLLGETSFAARKIITIKEDFNSGDRSINNLKDDLDAIKTEILRIKFGTSAANRAWYQNSPKSLADIGTGQVGAQLGSCFLNGGGVISWNSGTSEMSVTGDFTIRILGTAFVNTIQSSEFPLVIANGEVVYVDIDTGSTTDIIPTPIATASFVPAANRFIIARREGTDLLIYEQLTQV